MAKVPVNLAAAVRQRLRNLARSDGRDFQTLLVAFGLERLISRLSQSAHRDKFVLKGDNFRMIVSIPEFGENPANPARVVRRDPRSDVDAEQVTGEVARLLGVMSGELKRSDIQRRLGLKHEDHFREAYLLSALRMRLIQMTVPDKPNSRLQKYRLTARGQQWLARM